MTFPVALFANDTKHQSNNNLSLFGRVKLFQPQIEVGSLELPLGLLHSTGKLIQEARF